MSQQKKESNENNELMKGEEEISETATHTHADVFWIKIGLPSNFLYHFHAKKCKKFT